MTPGLRAVLNDLQPLRLLLLLLRVAAAVAVVVVVVLPATALPLRPLLRCCPSVRVCFVPQLLQAQFTKTIFRAEIVEQREKQSWDAQTPSPP